jgi:hypothetical protein
MRATEFLLELRDRMYEYLKSVLPTWPDYVLKDYIYQGFGRYNENPKRRLLTMLNDEGLSRDTQWQLVPNMQFTMSMFNPGTQKSLVDRKGGTANPWGVPRDTERHATQAQLIKQQGGISKEPVIMIKTSQGYNLVEGWHRTIQHFNLYPDGYVGPAWVAQSKK